MRLALVFNPFKYKVHEENLRVVQKYFGMFPPLSISWVAAIARTAGHEVTIIDARTLRLSMQDVAAQLKQFKPDVIGAMMTTYMFPETLEWLKYLHGELHTAGIKTKVLVGGYNLRVYPKESLSHPEIDFGCVEHAQYTVPSLFEHLEQGKSDLSAVPGLVWKRGAEIVINPHPQKVEFDKFPSPARDLLPNDLYAEFPTQHKNFTVMITSLGCPYTCEFCEAGGYAYNPRRPETVVAEMKECVEKYGIREIDIFDYEFTAMRSRVKEICELMIKNKLDIQWACRSRIDTVDSELLKLMHDAGCRRVYWGIEHSSQAVLDSLNKGITVEQIRETVKQSKQVGMQNLGFFLVGVPEETKKTVAGNVRFAKELGLDFVQFSKLLAKPLTPMWKQVVKDTGKDYWQDWILGKETDRELPRPWLKYIKNSDVDKLAKWAYVKYHSRIGFLISHTFKCKSLGEFIRKFFAYLEMLFTQEDVARPAERFVAYSGNLIKVLLRRGDYRKKNKTVQVFAMIALNIFALQFGGLSLYALDGKGKSAAVQLKDKQASRRMDAVVELKKYKGDKDAVNGIVNLIKTEQNIEVKIAAITVLGDIGDSSAVSTLQAVAADTSTMVGVAAQEALITLGDPQAVTYFAGVANDSTASLSDRMYSVRNLEKVKSVNAVNALRPLLSSEDAQLKLRAIVAIGNIGLPESISALQAVINDKDREVRLAVCNGLFLMGTSEALSAVSIMKNDVDEEIRNRVVRRLR